MDDLIRRQGAIEAIDSLYFDTVDDHDRAKEKIKRLPYAQPNLQPTCNQLATDTISRQAAIDAMLEAYPDNMDVEFILGKLPSAQPERKTGKWLHKDLDNFRKYEVICSVCGARFIGNYDAYDEPYDFNFCPNCGADMRDPLTGHMNPPEDET